MSRPPGVAALVLAAGQGVRLGSGRPKAFVLLAGRSLVERSIRILVEADVFERIQPVVPAEELDRFGRLPVSSRPLPGLSPAVAGGAERQDSMRAGLECLPPEIEWVAIHDAARCLVSAVDIRRVVETARASGAAILARRSPDTLKKVVGGRVLETPARESMWAAQTPQVIRRDWLVEGLESAERAGRRATDDAQLVEWMGREVHVVEARRPNPKVTLPEDLRAAEALLSDPTGAGGDAE